MTTGQLIKAARKKAKMTQAELAQKLGISYVGVSQWENDLRNPKYETLRRIADALGCDWLELVTPEEGAQAIVEHIAVKAKSETPIERVNRDMAQMTDEGQIKVADYAADILPRYRVQQAPQPPPPSQEDTDTAPPPDAPETPPEGK